MATPDYGYMLDFLKRLHSKAVKGEYIIMELTVNDDIVEVEDAGNGMEAFVSTGKINVNIKYKNVGDDY